jgi:DNA polymerase III subunit epsilon
MISEKLKLDKPLVCLDIETTGLSPINDRIIEIYCKKIFPDNSITEYYSLLNPGNVPITQEAFEKHNISIESLKDKPKFKDIYKELNEFLKDCHYCGYNIISFDLQFLLHEFYRCGLTFNFKKNKIIDVKNIYTKTIKPGTLEFAYKYLVGEKLTDNHRANVDVEATLAVLDKHIDILETDSLENLHNLSLANDSFDLSGRIIRKDNQYLFNFGKYKGRDVIEIMSNDQNYYDWLMSSDDTPLDTKLILKVLNLKLKK